MVELTKEIVKSTNLPVTVKTRLGWDNNSIKIVEVAERLQDVGIHAISIHGRTRKQMYKGEADWSHIREVKENPRLHIPVIGNGDIDSPEKAMRYKNEYGVDGLMIGRASIGNPWIFSKIKHYVRTGEHLEDPGFKEKIEAVRKHLSTSISWKGERLGVLEMRRHYGSYFRGLRQVKQYRSRLVTTDEPNQIYDILNEMEHYYSTEPELTNVF